MTAPGFTAAMTDAVRPAGPVSPAQLRTHTGTVVGGCQCGAGISLAYGENVTVQCPGCGTPVQLTRVSGTLSQDICDGECMGAIGPYCVCGCGGRNHGKGWTVRILPTWVPIPGAKVPVVEYVDKTPAAAAARTRAAAVRKRKGDANRASAAARRAEREAADAAIRDATRAEMMTQPGVSALMGERYAGSSSRFVLDMRGRVRDGEELTPGQLAAVARMVDQDAERDAARAAEAARAEAAAAAGVRVEPGRQLIRGVITRHVSEEHGPEWSRRHRHVITVQDAAGRRYRGTLPDALEPVWSREIADAFVGWPDRIVGQRVTLIAGEVEPSNRDPLFGFYKRPTVPAGTPRLSYVGPADQDPDGEVPAVKPTRPRKPRAARPAPPPPMSAEARAAAEAATARLAALDLAVSVIRRGENAAAAGWAISGRPERGGFPETWGPAGSVHMSAVGGNGDADPLRYELRAFTPTGAHVHTMSVSTLDDALTCGRALAVGPAPTTTPPAPPAPAPVAASEADGWGAVLGA